MAQGGRTGNGVIHSFPGAAASPRLTGAHWCKLRAVLCRRKHSFSTAVLQTQDTLRALGIFSHK